MLGLSYLQYVFLFLSFYAFDEDAHISIDDNER